MNTRNKAPLLVAAAMAALTACSGKPADNAVETKTQSTTTSPQGKVETTLETKQVGNTLEATTQTNSKTEGGGTAKTTVETFIGAVTVYEPNKKIEVLTGENTRHSVDLDGKKIVANISGPIVVGSHVRLVEEKSENGSRVTVTLEGKS